MPLERDEILLENLRESLAVYQRAVLWSMTAAAAFFLLSLRLGNPNLPPIPVLYGELSVPAAWAVALLLFFLLGGYATSAIRSAEGLLDELKPSDDLRKAILSTCTLATIANGFYRVGAVLFCPLTVFVASAIELRREWADQRPSGWSWLIGLLLFCVLILGPYVSIVTHVWHPFGSRSTKSMQMPAGPIAKDL